MGALECQRLLNLANISKSPPNSMFILLGICCLRFPGSKVAKTKAIYGRLCQICTMIYIYIYLFIYISIDLLIYLYIFIYIYFIYVPLLQYASSVATPGLVLWEKIMSAWMVRWVGQPATSPNRTSSQSHLQPGNLRSYQLRLPESNFNLHSPKKISMNRN